jgi:hypothetical protein
MILARCLFRGQWIVTHDAIRDVMYAFVRESEHIVWREWGYAFTPGIFLHDSKGPSFRC